MNHIYSVIFNPVLGLYQVVGELVKGKKKSKTIRLTHCSIDSHSKNLFTTPSLLSLSIAVILGLSSTAVQSKDVTWQANSSTWWDTIIPNWKTTNSSATTFANGDNVLFDNSRKNKGDIRITANGITAGNIQFDNALNNNYRITSQGRMNANGKLTLLGRGLVDISGIQGTNVIQNGVEIQKGSLRISSEKQLGTTLDKLIFSSNAEKVTYGKDNLLTLEGKLNTAIINYLKSGGNNDRKKTLNTLQKSLDVMINHNRNNGTAGNGYLGSLIVAAGQKVTFNNSAPLSVSYEKAASIYLENNANMTFSNHTGRVMFIDTRGILILNAADNAYFDFSANKLTGWGNSGAVIYNHGTFLLNNARFSGNHSDASAGAITNQEMGLLNLNNVSFTNNTSGSAGWAGGAIYNDKGIINITNSTFIENITGTVGGAIASYGNMNIQDSLFRGNQSHGGAGGAINTSSNTNIAHSTFENNYSTSYGGAISNNTELMYLTKNRFISNTAVNYGGAIANWISGNIILVDGYFKNNKSNGIGGAIYSTEFAKISDSLFVGNSAKNDGGAIYNNKTLNLTNTSFVGNTATLGAAIYQNSGSTSIAVKKGKTSLFSGNMAGNTANSIMFDGTSALNVITNSGGILDMRDPMRSHSVARSTIKKLGYGVWKLGGANNFVAGSTTKFSVEEGMLYLYRAGEVGNANSANRAARVGSGTLELKGSNSQFSLGTSANNTTTTLAFGGGNKIITDGSITLHAGNGAKYKTTLAFDLLGAKSETSPTSTNAIAEVRAGQGLKIDTSGGGKLNIDLLGLNTKSGTYTLLYDNGNSKAFIGANINSAITLHGQSVSGNSRLNGKLALKTSANNNALQVSQGAIINGNMTWTNKDSRNSDWDILSNNWTMQQDSRVTQFVDNDSVIFNDQPGKSQVINVKANGGHMSVNQMTINNARHAYTFNGGDISINDGKGTMAVSGAATVTLNNQVYGNATVSGGRLTIGESTANTNAAVRGHVQMNNGTSISGYGQVDRLTLNKGARIDVSSNRGTLTLGELLMNSGSILRFTANANGAHDTLKVSTTTGTGSAKATIQSGSILDIVAGKGNWALATKYTVLEADNGISGKFSTVKTNLAFLKPIVDYTSNQVNLTLERNNVTMASLARAVNQDTVANVIDNLGAGNAIRQQVLLMSTAQARAAYDNLSGEIHASLASALVNNSRYARHSVYQHLDNEQGLLVNHASDGNGVWISTWGHNGNFKDDGNAAKMDNKGWGVMVGSDAISSGAATLGVALGYEKTDLDVKSNRASEADVDTLQATLYNRMDIGDIKLKSGLSYRWSDISTTRDVSVGTINSSNSADYKAHGFEAYAEGGYNITLSPSLNIMPYLGLEYFHLKQNDFNEKGDNRTTLHGKSNKTNSGLATLGVKGDWKLNDSSAWYAKAGWQHHIGQKATSAELNFSGSNSFDVSGVETDRNSAVIGTGVNIKMGANTTLAVGYEGQLGSQVREHMGQGRIEYRF